MDVTRVLVVDDEKRIADFISRGLESAGYQVDTAHDGTSALERIHGLEYDLIVLDLGLPDMDGLKVLEKIRNRKAAPSVLILSARGNVDDRVKGLEMGADDYMVKPFAFVEFLARVRALLRRAAGRAEPLLAHGRLRLDPAKHAAWLGEQPLQLSAREFALLQALLERPETVLSRAQLEERLYGWNEPVGSNTVEVHIHNLRRKLGERAIRNVRGVGYTIGNLEPAG